MPEETKQRLFHRVAQGVAKRILEHSWEANGVEGVLLYGSQLALILFGLQQLIKILIQKFRAP